MAESDVSPVLNGHLLSGASTQDPTAANGSLDNIDFNSPLPPRTRPSIGRKSAVRFARGASGDPMTPPSEDPLAFNVDETVQSVNWGRKAAARTNWHQTLFSDTIQELRFEAEAE